MVIIESKVSRLIQNVLVKAYVIFPLLNLPLKVYLKKPTGQSQWDEEGVMKGGVANG